jgi:hypothetical protein
MKTKIKKILITIWKALGIIILTYFIFWFVKVKILNQYGMVSDVIRLTISLSVLFTYSIITLILLLIKYKKGVKRKNDNQP